MEWYKFDMNEIVVMADVVESILLAKQIAPTAMRLLVLEFLLKQKNAVTLTILEKDFGPADRITLYRTLKTFEKKGLVHTIKDGTTARYALCETDCDEERHTDTHVHFWCTACKKTFCLPKTKIPRVEMPGGFVLQDISLNAHGYCNSCNPDLTMQ
jgi:Fur family ferric uptake transcriptional regulator